MLLVRHIPHFSLDARINQTCKCFSSGTEILIAHNVLDVASALDVTLFSHMTIRSGDNELYISQLAFFILLLHSRCNRPSLDSEFGVDCNGFAQGYSYYLHEFLSLVPHKWKPVAAVAISARDEAIQKKYADLVYLIT
jgi:hypothetical protein